METTTHTIKNQNGDKVGVACWSGEWNENNVKVGWEAYDLSDHFVGKTEVLMQARDLLNGFDRPVQYKTINDAAEFTQIDGLGKSGFRGGAKIWYVRGGLTRDFCMGYEWLKENGGRSYGDEQAIPHLPNIQTIEKTHTCLGEISETDLDNVYRIMQGHIWSPAGAANTLIEKSGSHHTSMSMGDIIEIEGRLFMVDSVGFVELDEPAEVVSPAVEGMFGKQVRAKIAFCPVARRQYIRLQEQDEDGTWRDEPGHNSNNMEKIMLALMGGE